MCYPTVSSSEVLANRFADFYHKMEVIRNDLFARNAPFTNPPPYIQACYVEFTEFDNMTDQVKNLIHSSCLKTCSLDPLPAPIIKGCADILLPVLTRMINMLIETATVPVQRKEAMIRSKLKSESLDHEVYANFRPISNMKFISKMIEKAVSDQLTNYLKANGLAESLQSAYKSFHSTKTVLVKVHNHVVSVIDNQCYVILLLLDLSVAFDTVDHKILLSRLSFCFCINRRGLSLYQSCDSYKQVVNVKGTTSCSKNLQCGIP